MRIRIFYAKLKELRYTGVLDMQSIWQRSFKRADLFVEYSQGFHPQPKIQIPFPLPLGFTGRNEIVDVWIKEDAFQISKVESKLRLSVPKGIQISLIQEINPSEKSIASASKHSDYEIRIFNPESGCYRLTESFNYLMKQSSIIRTRNKKQYDLRSLILSYSYVKNENNFCFYHLSLLAHPSQTGRPDEVMMQLGVDLSDCEIERLNVHFEP